MSAAPAVASLRRFVRWLGMTTTDNDERDQDPSRPTTLAELLRRFAAVNHELAICNPRLKLPQAKSLDSLKLASEGRELATAIWELATGRVPTEEELSKACEKCDDADLSFSIRLEHVRNT